MTNVKNKHEVAYNTYLNLKRKLKLQQIQLKLNENDKFTENE